MKTKQLLLLTAGFILAVYTLKAQETLWFTEIQQEIAIGKELFRTAKYNAAYRHFEKVREMADEKSEIYSEANYYIALSALRSEHVTGEKLLANFLSDHADSPYSNYAHFYYGEYQFDKNRHQLALRSLANVDRQGLSESDRVKAVH